MRLRKLFLILPASLLVLMPLISFSQWKSVYDPDKPAFLDLDLVSDSIGCFVGSKGSVHRTENAGKDFFKQSTGVTHTLYGVDLQSADRGWVVGEYVILKTEDGGNSWNSLKDSLGAYLFSVHFLDTSAVWACGYSGTILYSENGGDNWGQQTTPTDHELQAVMASSKDVAWAVGLNGTILRTTNGGGPPV